MARHLTPIRAIRVKCLSCSGDSYKEVNECPIKHCALWPYRLGKRPTLSKEVELPKDKPLAKS